MKFTAAHIAQMLNGTVEGDADAQVGGLSTIEDGKPGTLTFLSNPKYNGFIYTTGATIAIVANEFAAEQALPSGLTLIRVADPRMSFATLLETYSRLMAPKPGIHPSAVIGQGVSIPDTAYIGAGAIIGEHVEIGEHVLIHPGVTLAEHVKIGAKTILYAGVHVYHRCCIGASCTIHSGVIIGSDGFGFQPNAENYYAKVPHIGDVIIEDHVEIGSNTTIDRATLGSTIIRKGVKLDNLIQVAHNVEIGENTVIAAQTGIAGSTKIGRNCLIGGQVGIVGHITIADGTRIAAQSGVGSSIKEENTTVQGSPAFGIGDYKKSYVAFRNLPELIKKHNL
jgi:UDP-3-O-[3-hydroxymyristoyl] glucosamine N-acyltransferase